MAELTRRATALIKEMLTADGKLPAYNEEVVRQTIQQIHSHQAGIEQLIKEVNEAGQQRQRQQQQQQQQQQGEESAGGGPLSSTSQQSSAHDWASSPEHAGAIVVHHETILKLKRILMTYQRMRADCIIKIRRQERVLRQEVRENMSPAELQFWSDYDKGLSTYMGTGEDGIGMDLTLDVTPPKDTHVRVMVLRDHGSFSFSHSACVPLVKGSVHSLRPSEAEHLVRLGVLQILDPNS